MTREEAKNIVAQQLSELLSNPLVTLDEKYVEAEKMAIKALEKEPCEDAISRKAVIDTLAKTGGIRGDALKALYDLPPVTPQPKMGRWITWKEANNIIPSETRFECSVCHDAAYTLCNGLDLLSPYCPNCGADMRGDANVNDK